MMEDGAENAMHSIAISLKRIADAVEMAIGILVDDEIDDGHDPYEQMANQS